MKAGRVLRQMVIARIEAQVPDLNGKVVDQAVAGTKYPYASLGMSYTLPAKAQCIDARVRTLQVDIWSDGDKGLCEDLTDAVTAALDGWTDRARLKMPPLHVSMARVMDNPNGGFHGVVQVEARAEG